MERRYHQSRSVTDPLACQTSIFAHDRRAYSSELRRVSRKGLATAIQLPFGGPVIQTGACLAIDQGRQIS